MYKLCGDVWHAPKKKTTFMEKLIKNLQNEQTEYKSCKKKIQKKEGNIPQVSNERF